MHSRQGTKQSGDTKLSCWWTAMRDREYRYRYIQGRTVVEASLLGFVFKPFQALGVGCRFRKANGNAESSYDWIAAQTHPRKHTHTHTHTAPEDGTTRPTHHLGQVVDQAVPKWRSITSLNSCLVMNPLPSLSAAATSWWASGALGPTARRSSACARVCMGGCRGRWPGRRW